LEGFADVDAFFAVFVGVALAVDGLLVEGGGDFAGDAVGDGCIVDGGADVVEESLPWRGHFREEGVFFEGGFLGGVAEPFDGGGVGERGDDGVDGVLAVVVTGFLAGAEDGIESPAAAQEGGQRTAAGMDAAAALGIDAAGASAVEKPDIFDGEAGGVAGVVELLGGEVVEGGEVFHLEFLELHAAAVPWEFFDAVEDFLPALRSVAVGFPGGVVVFVGAVFLGIAEGLVHEGVVEGAAERDDVFDVELGVVAEEGVPTDGFAGVGAGPSAFFCQEEFELVISGWVCDADFALDLLGGALSGFAIGGVVRVDALAVFAVLFHLAGEFDADFVGATVLSQDGVDHFSKFGECPLNGGVADVENGVEAGEVGTDLGAGLVAVDFLAGGGVGHAFFHKWEEFGEGLSG